MTWIEVLRAREAEFRRAPSAHNTQPWVLRYGTDEIRIGADPDRSLPVSDPTGRDLELSLGAAVECALVVAADAGLAVAATCGPGPAAVLRAAADRYPTPFTAADVTGRRVARGRYAPGPVPAAVLAALEPGLVPVPGGELARDLRTADRWLFATAPVTRELRDWLRLHPRHPRYALDGLTDRALALSRVEAWGLGVALRTLPLTRGAGLPGLLATAGGGLLRGDGTVLVLTAQPGEGRVDAGRRLLRNWLALHRHGLAVHPLSQLLDCPASAARLRERMPAEPLAVFRVGRPVGEPVRSARLPVSCSGGDVPV